MSTLLDLAEAYAFGLLDERSAAEVEARILTPATDEDRVLAAAVGGLRDRLLPIDLTAPELPLRPGAWERLEARLAPSAAPASPERDDAARADAAPPPVRGWRHVAFAAIAAAALLAVGLAWQTLSGREPAVLAVLLDQGGAPVALVEAYADNSALVTPLTGVDPGPARVLQLWTKPDPSGPPISLGLLEAAADIVARNPDLPSPAAGQLFEITSEPMGGSPTGLPTGPIVGIGNAQTPIRE